MVTCEINLPSGVVLYFCKAFLLAGQVHRMVMRKNRSGFFREIVKREYDRLAVGCSQSFT